MMIIALIQGTALMSCMTTLYANVGQKLVSSAIKIRSSALECSTPFRPAPSPPVVAAAAAAQMPRNASAPKSNQSAPSLLNQCVCVCLETTSLS